MNSKCDGCRHNIPSSTDFCYMFEKEPEELPCGQHDKYYQMRKAFGRLLLKNPFLMHMVINEAMVMPHSWKQESLGDMVDEWHESDIIQPLHEYLGLTLEEYKRWVEVTKEGIHEQ